MQSENYLTAKTNILALPRQITKNSIQFLRDGKPFAGINKNYVWMCVSRQNNKPWYSYLSSIEEKTLGLDNLKYSESCELAKEIFCATH